MDLDQIRNCLATELETVLEQRKALDTKAKKLAAIIQEMGNLGENEIRGAAPGMNVKRIDSLSRIDAIREILSRSGLAMLPRQVRDRLRMYGCELPENSMAPIHLALKRLRARGEVEQVLQADGKVAYRWISSVDRVLEALRQEISEDRGRQR